MASCLSYFYSNNETRMPAPLSLDLRERIIRLVDSGLSHDDIAEDLEVSQTAVSSLVRHQSEYGHLYPIRPPGNTPTINENDYSIIREIVKNKSDLTLSAYAIIIAEETDKRVMSNSTICRLFKKLDLRRKKKSKYAEERDREDVKKRRVDYKDALEDGLVSGEICVDDLVFLDEAGLKLGQTPDYAWAEGGERAVSPEPKHLGKNITLVSAMSLTGVLAAMYCICTFNGEGFEAFVENLLIPALRPGQILILDNVNFHKRASVIQAIKSAGVKVVFLPQYSPELNPIENMWSKLKTYLKTMKVKTLDDLNHYLKEGLERITEYDCESWYEHCGYIV